MKQNRKKQVEESIREIPTMEFGDEETTTVLRFIGFLLICPAILILLIQLSGSIELGLWGQWITILSLVLGIYFCFIRHEIKGIVKGRCHRLCGDGIEYTGPFGFKKKHSYGEWAQSMEKGHYTVGRRGYEVWLGLEKITFFYNVGIKKERQKSIYRYALFVDYISKEIPWIREKMPKFTDDNIDLLDKRCYYYRSRFYLTLFTLGNLLLFLLIHGAMYGMKGVVLSSIPFVLFQGFIIYKLIRNSCFDYKNELEIRKVIPDETGLVRDNGIGILRPYWGFIHLILLYVLTGIIQWHFIWY